MSMDEIDFEIRIYLVSRINTAAEGYEISFNDIWWWVDFDIGIDLQLWIGKECGHVYTGMG